MMIKPHEALVLFVEPGGNLAIRMHAMRKQTWLERNELAC